jgi:hypothetical protein
MCALEWRRASCADAEGLALLRGVTGFRVVLLLAAASLGSGTYRYKRDMRIGRPPGGPARCPTHSDR